MSIEGVKIPKPVSKKGEKDLRLKKQVEEIQNEELEITAEDKEYMEKLKSGGGFLEKVKEMGPELIAVAAAVALANAGAHLDSWFNPEIFEALRQNGHWYSLFTTKHEMARLLIDHPAVMNPIITGLLWIAAKLKMKKSKL